MILIVESGSTKADFVLINQDGQLLLSFQTMGLNPLFLNTEQIKNQLKSQADLMRFSEKIKKVYFFGAGCRSEKLNQVVQKAFEDLFQNAHCQVDSDLMAACMSVSFQRKSLVGILGTGSNACYFDTEKVIKKTASLGFILGDEGSGNHIGKEIIKNYYAGFMPSDLSNAFENRFHFSLEDILENVYQKPNPNAFLASLSSFAFEHKNHVFIQGILKECFQTYFEIQVKPYENLNVKEINFVGSIAYLFEDTLKEVADEYGYSVHRIVQHPMSSMVEIFSKEAQIKNKKL